MKQSLISILIVLSSLFIFSTSTSAQKLVNKSRVKKQLPENIQLEKSLLWEISGNGLTRPSYLFGTIHVICEDDFLWLEQFENAFNKADEIILEVDANEIMKFFEDKFDPEIVSKYFPRNSQNSVLDKYKNKVSNTSSSSSLKERLPIEIFNRGKMSEPSSFDRIKKKILQLEGLYFSYFLENSTLLKSIDDCKKSTSYEVKLVEKGLIKGKKFSYLESVEEQIEALGAMEDNYNRLNAPDNDNRTYEEKVDELIRIYKNQDIMALYDYMILPSMGLIDLDAILFDRNELWVKRLPQKMKKDKSYFIAVGAGHLSSTKGLIYLLRQQGYIVRPIFSKTK